MRRSTVAANMEIDCINSESHRKAMEDKVIRRPELLYLSSVIPTKTGMGNTMRAGINLEILSEWFDIDLMIVNQEQDVTERAISDEVRHWCRDVVFLNAAAQNAPVYGWIQALKSQQIKIVAEAIYPRSKRIAGYDLFAPQIGSTEFAERSYTIIYAFRLRMAPLVRGLVRHRADITKWKVLDLDDFESKTVRRCARVLGRHLGRQVSVCERIEAAKLQRLEQRYLPMFDQVYVCSELDKTQIQTKYKCKEVCVVPNAVRMPSTTSSKDNGEVFKYLFVGTMSYTPNEDAMLFFCKDVLPILKHKASRALEVLIVGREPSDRIQALSASPEVTVVGEVSDLSKYYSHVDVVVVPIRCGGGTRIKILEAFSHRRPVVTTTIGAEGLEVRDGTHVLIGDTAAAFASHCAILMKRPETQERLVTNGFQLFKERYSYQAVSENLRSAYATLLESESEPF